MQRRFATPRMRSSGRFFTPSPSSSPPTCRYSRCSRRRPSVQADGVDRCLRAAGRHRIFHVDCACPGQFFFPHGAREWRNPVMEWLTDRYRRCGEVGHRESLDHRWRCGRGFVGCRVFWHSVESLARSFCPIWTKAPFGRVARWRQASARRKARALTIRPGYIFASFPEVTKVVRQAGRPDDGTDTRGFCNTEYFVDLKPKEQWRPVFHQRQRGADRRDGSRTGEIPRGVLEFLAAH